MKAAVITILLAITAVCNAQIKTREVAEYKPNFVYDSLQNVPTPGIPAIKGQEILVLSERGFSKKPNEKERLPLIVNKYYKIVDCTISDNDTYALLQLFGKEKADTIYCKLTGGGIDFPAFITIGYFDKMKQLHIGKQLKLRAQDDYIDINTGEKRHYTEKDMFTCIDVVLLAKTNQPAYILRNDKKEEIAAFFKGFENPAGEHVIERFEFIK